jgi:hypothetical protein
MTIMGWMPAVTTITLRLIDNEGNHWVEDVDHDEHKGKMRIHPSTVEDVDQGEHKEKLLMRIHPGTVDRLVRHLAELPNMSIMN